MLHQINNHLISLIISERVQGSDLESFSPADWDLIVRQAQAEDVTSLRYWRLSRSERINLLPDALQKSLRAMYFSVMMNNEAIIKELQALTHLFTQAEIPVVALKGACFALTIYPDIGLRPDLAPKTRSNLKVRVMDPR